ncbi:unnamed protein product [Arabidopsis halleri]
MITFIGGKLGHFLETDFGGDGDVLVDYVRFRLLWNIEEPLRFQRLFQFASECPMNNNIPPPPPEEDDDDPDYNPEAPDANEPTDTTDQVDKHVTDSGKNEESQAAPQKRKIEPSPTTENIRSFPLVCCDMRHTFATEDTEHHVSKRQSRQSEIREVRNWFLVQTQPLTQSNDAGRTTPTTPTPNRDGTVGQKPMEPQ